MIYNNNVQQKRNYFSLIYITSISYSIGLWETFKQHLTNMFICHNKYQMNISGFRTPLEHCEESFQNLGTPTIPFFFIFYSILYVKTLNLVEKQTFNHSYNTKSEKIYSKYYWLNNFEIKLVDWHKIHKKTPDYNKKP